MIKKIKYEDSDLNEMEILEWNKAIDLINNGAPMICHSIKGDIAICIVTSEDVDYKFSIPKDALEAKT